MAVSWSHCVLKVNDIETMIEFYSEAFGFRLADRGELGPDMEIAFLSGSSSDHHQIAFMSGRPEGDGGSLDHNAFRVETIAEVRDMYERMKADDRVKYASPLTHGNAVSVYFADPEGNGVEVFCDTPWHVKQPQAKKWDPSMSDDEVLAWLEETYRDNPEFMPMEDYRAKQADVFGESE